MRAVIQRVTRAEVKVDGESVGKIDGGLLVLMGAGADDTEADCEKLADKIVKLRIFSDENDKTNISVNDVHGDILAVSQFTLYADTSSRRPGFTGAARPDAAAALYEAFMARCRERGFPVEHGEFCADMQVDSRNDGPVTILFDTDRP